jgi:hypothetical protein
VAYTDGRILSRNAILAVQTQRSIDQRESKTAIRTFSVDDQGFYGDIIAFSILYEASGHVLAAPFPLEVRGATTVDVSPSGRLMMVVRGDVKPPGSSEPQQFIEIWDQSGLISSVPTQGKHGKIATKG